MDAVRQIVDSGQALNYDACVSNGRVWGIAANMRRPGDDNALNNTRYMLCNSFYKNGYWRGGISPQVDDRKDVTADEWTPSRRRAFLSIRDEIVSNYNNAINTIQNRSIPAALDYPGAAGDVNNAKNLTTDLKNRLSAQTGQLNAYLTALKRLQDTTIVQEVNATELKVRNLEKQTQQFREIAELRKEQATGLYNKYESNFHSTFFGYEPLHPASRPALLFTAFFLGFLAIIGIIIRLLITYSKSPDVGGAAVAAGSSFFGSSSSSGSSSGTGTSFISSLSGFKY